MGSANAVLVGMPMALCIAGCAMNGLTSPLPVQSAHMPSLPAQTAQAAQAAPLVQPSQSIALQLHAGANLNRDANGHALAVVARIYSLRDRDAFDQAPLTAFLSAQTEKEALGPDLIEVKEVVLVPGQRYQATQQISSGAAFIGVVALFHHPAPQRWRLTLPAAPLVDSGLVIGLHACALSVGRGGDGAWALLSAATCQATATATGQARPVRPTNSEA